MQSWLPRVAAPDCPVNTTEAISWAVPRAVFARLDGDGFEVDGRPRLLASRCHLENGFWQSAPPKLSPVSGLTCVVLRA